LSPRPFGQANVPGYKRGVHFVVTVLTLFGMPTDQATFDDYFEANHHPLLVKIPQVEKLVVNRIAGAATGEAPYHLIVELQFASEEAMQVGLNSEQGQAMARDFALFASGGVTVLFSQATTESLGSE